MWSLQKFGVQGLGIMARDFSELDEPRGIRE